MMKDELISRAAALNVIQRNAFHEGRQWVFRDKIIKELCDISAVNAEPVRRGMWKEDPYIWRCSECDKWLMLEQGTADMNYCPHCGAKMDGGED